MSKSRYCTMSVPVVILVSEPLMPVTVELYVPGGVLAATEIVSVDELPVAGLGLKAPLAGLAESVTAPVNPLIRLMLTV